MLGRSASVRRARLRRAGRDARRWVPQRRSKPARPSSLGGRCTGRRSLPGAGCDPPTRSACSRCAGSRSDSCRAGTLTSPAQAVGRAAAATIPPGAYVLAAQLTNPGSERHSTDPASTTGESPSRSRSPGRRLWRPRDTTRRAPASTSSSPPSRVRAAAGGERGLRLAGSSSCRLTESAAGGAAGFPGPGSGAGEATLALTRSEAIHLIQAENFARQVRLIPH